jgi:hypothetical protein
MKLCSPYDALRDNEKPLCGNNIGQEAYAGTWNHNILGMLRTDTLRIAGPADQGGQGIQDASLPCIEVMLQLSSFWTRSSNGSHRALSVVRTEPQQNHVIVPLQRVRHYRRQTYAPPDALVHGALRDSLFASNANDVRIPFVTAIIFRR